MKLAEDWNFEGRNHITGYVMNQKNSLKQQMKSRARQKAKYYANKSKTLTNE